MANEARVTLRLPDDVVRRARRVRDALNKAGTGFVYGESDVLRAALVRGLDALESDSGPIRERRPAARNPASRHAGRAKGR